MVKRELAVKVKLLIFLQIYVPTLIYGHEIGYNADTNAGNLLLPECAWALP